MMPRGIVKAREITRCLLGMWGESVGASGSLAARTLGTLACLGGGQCEIFQRFLMSQHAVYGALKQ
jgi:hypothetical protein